MHIHWFKFQFRKGAHKYYECRCGARKSEPILYLCGPEDKKWLNHVPRDEEKELEERIEFIKRINTEN